MTLLTLADQLTGSALLPPSASANAPTQDWLFYFIWYLSVFFFVLIVAMMVFFAFKYRRKHPDQQPTGSATHSTALELAWTLPPLVIVMFIFWVGLAGFMDIANPYANATVINVRSQKWSWSFAYPLPNGGTFDDDQLHVPVNRPVELVLNSTDVIHSLFIPAFRVKRDVVPGRYNHVWFKPTQAGEYPLYCAEYCGTRHSEMVTRVIVHAPGEYEQWLANASRSAFEELPDDLYQQWRAITGQADFTAFKSKLAAMSKELAEKAEKLKPPFVIGEEIVKKKNCMQCHSTDGSPLSAPTWKGLWMRNVSLETGPPVAADENYIRESILDPAAKIVSGYKPQMPTFQGQITDKQIDAIIAYIKTLK